MKVYNQGTQYCVMQPSTTGAGYHFHHHWNRDVVCECVIASITANSAFHYYATLVTISIVATLVTAKVSVCHCADQYNLTHSIMHAYSNTGGNDSIRTKI